MDTLQKKQKKKKAVNANLLFVGLQDIERAAGAPLTAATVFQPLASDLGTRTQPIQLDHDPLDPFMALADRFRSINSR